MTISSSWGKKSDAGFIYLGNKNFPDEMSILNTIQILGLKTVVTLLALCKRIQI